MFTQPLSPRTVTSVLLLQTQLGAVKGTVRKCLWWNILSSNWRRLDTFSTFPLPSDNDSSTGRAGQSWWYDRWPEETPATDGHNQSSPHVVSSKKRGHHCCRTQHLSHIRDSKQGFCIAGNASWLSPHYICCLTPPPSLMSACLFRHRLVFNVSVPLIF